MDICKNIWTQKCIKVNWHTLTAQVARYIMHIQMETPKKIHPCVPGQIHAHTVHTNRHRGTKAHKRTKHNNPFKCPSIALSCDHGHHTHTQSASVSFSLGRAITVEVTLPKLQALWVEDSTIMHPCLLAEITRYTHLHIHASYFQLKRSSVQQLFA